MKYCISGRHQYSVLKNTDEVKVKYEDKERILDFVEKIPDKTIILDMPEFDVNYDTWRMYDDKFEGGFYLALHHLTRADEMNIEGIKWYWPYPITSFYELREILDLGPAYVLIGAPLTFDLKTVRDVVGPDVKVRMVCNCARPVHLIANAGAPGIKGQYVRPEDVYIYDGWVDVFEFDGVTNELTKEKTLLEIYKEKQSWPGNLNLLITHLNVDIDNRGILNEFGARRANCRQRCMSTGSCHFCDIAFNFAEQLRKEHLRRKQQAAIDNN